MKVEPFIAVTTLNSRMFDMKKHILILTMIALFGCTMNVSSVVLPDTVRIQQPVFHFRTDQSMLLKDYKENAQTLEQMRQLFADPRRVAAIDSVLVVGITSPDGNENHNETLALERAQEVRMVIHWKHPEVDRSKIWISSLAIGWEAIAPMVEADKYLFVREKAEILALVRSNRSSDEKQRLLMQMNQGITWRQIVDRHLWKLKSGTVRVVFRTSPPSDLPLPDAMVYNAEAYKETFILPAAVRQSNSWQAETTPQQPDDKYICKPLFAVKTNLLFDAATLFNIELEVPLGKRWSLAAEWIFPWWLWEQHQHCLQLLSGTLEGRYWLGNRRQHQPLTGWFVGVYTSGGLYDLEWNGKGYQGEFFVAAGASGGFAHPIGRHLHMEYTLGVGYMQTDYRRYQAGATAQGEWGLYKREAGRYTWMGPTRVKVSLVWAIGNRKKGRMQL